MILGILHFKKSPNIRVDTGPPIDSWARSARGNPPERQLTLHFAEQLEVLKSSLDQGRLKLYLSQGTAKKIPKVFSDTDCRQAWGSESASVCNQRSETAQLYG